MVSGKGFRNLGYQSASHVASLGGVSRLSPKSKLSWCQPMVQSMNNTNTLISGDNKGWASYLLERETNGPTSDTALPGQGGFVAAFAASNLGDVTPNTQGSVCVGGPQAGKSCDTLHSTCVDILGRQRCELCHSSGPGVDMFDSTRIIAERQVCVSARFFCARCVSVCAFCVCVRVSRCVAAL